MYSVSKIMFMYVICNVVPRREGREKISIEYYLLVDEILIQKPVSLCAVDSDEASGLCQANLEAWHSFWSSHQKPPIFHGSIQRRPQSLGFGKTIGYEVIESGLLQIWKKGGEVVQDP